MVVDNKTSISPSLRATSDLPLTVQVYWWQKAPDDQKWSTVAFFLRRTGVSCWYLMRLGLSLTCWMTGNPHSSPQIHQCSTWSQVLLSVLFWWWYTCTIMIVMIVCWQYGENMTSKLWEWFCEQMKMSGDPEWKTRDDLMLFVGSASRSQNWRVRCFNWNYLELFGIIWCCLWAWPEGPTLGGSGA